MSEEKTAPQVAPNKCTVMTNLIVAEAEKMKISRIELLYSLKALFAAFVSEENRAVENDLLKQMEKEIKAFRRARLKRRA